MELGGRIYEFRKKAGLSQEELADRLGVSRQAVGKWEQGSALPDIGRIEQISQVLGVTASQLLGLENEGGGQKYAAWEDIEELLAGYGQEQRRFLKEQQEKYERERRLREDAESARQAEEKKRRRRRYTAAAAFAVAVAVLAVIVGNRISRLEEQLEKVRRETSRGISELNWSISDMQSSITGLMLDQASLFSDWSVDVTGYDSAAELVELTMIVSPKSFQESTQVEFILKDAGTGESTKALAEAAGSDFMASVAMPSGVYVLEAALIDGEQRQVETLAERCSLSPIGLEAEYYQEAFIDDDTVWAEGGSIGEYSLAGYMTILCGENEWPARPLKKVELTVTLNGALLETIALDAGDTENWPESFTPPQEPELQSSGIAQPTEISPPEGGMLFVDDFSLKLQVKPGDELVIGLNAEDELGLIYSCPQLLERSFRGNSGGGSLQSGHLNMDYSLYDLGY